MTIFLLACYVWDTACSFSPRLAMLVWILMLRVFVHVARLFLQLMNKMKPIWMRSPKDVKEEEYAEFYKSTFKAWDELAAHSHFSLEGQVEFRALLFVPSVLPYELSRNMFDESSRNMRLYVKRVFINDKFEELIPRWLLFLRGVVSSHWPEAWSLRLEAPLLSRANPPIGVGSPVCHG